jgi:23S rRNA pseudouridine1911/1915/1917 synthase
VWEERRASLLEVRLETGRTHQIRVHMASIGHPVAADPVYGRGSAEHRIWLHAVGLSFEHPITGARIEVASPVPDDLQTVVDRLGEPEA